ncbi:tetratricopeptide repeat protein [Prochlorococcus sp. MIT 1201]|uniref:O-linked N-acetylglucosamine transferase, SPINDLY family protein n=1 Tax=Prochlorococcus sp. MIT 1201 TaxID=3082535 RepID=UPI0039A40A86
MPNRKSSNKRQAQGFNTDSKEDINAIALKYIKERNWNKAIDTLTAARSGSKSVLKQQVNQVFNEAVKAGQQNKDLDSLALHCQLLALDPGHAIGMRNFAMLLKRSGQYQAAHHFIKKSLAIKPDCPNGLNTLGTILADLGKNEEAIEVFKKALAADPSNCNAHNNLANQYHLNAEIDLAFIHTSRAIKEESTRAVLWLDHLTHLNRVCDYERLDKINWWNVLNLIPPGWISTSFLQVLTLSETEDEQKLLLHVIERWGDTQQQQAIEQPIEAFSKPPISDREPLRIGFISADFRDHSVARFIWPLFENLDRSEFSLYCYSTYQAKDAWREKFESSATKLREVSDLSPQQLSEVIRRDEIHVLFDLTGFTNGSRTGSLAWRAAPAQVSWLGFPGTSGLKTMDYLFLDQYLTPTNQEFITERPLQSRGTTVCFSEIEPAPITPTIPEKQRGYLTFGTLNNTYKMTRRTIKRWASTLQELPTAQFLFVRREFQSHLLRQNILKEFEREGISRERIHFYNNRLENRHYLDCYNEIDLTLDTFPVTGGTTTTDALWMGVPVIGLEGPNIHQRVCSAILHHAGHPEWIARSEQEFKQIALNLAGDQQLRMQLRQSLREEIKQSRLCDSIQFASDFSDCMRQLRQSLA